MSITTVVISGAETENTYTASYVYSAVAAGHLFVLFVVFFSTILCLFTLFVFVCE
jgi:hypothetical protein